MRPVLRALVVTVLLGAAQLHAEDFFSKGVANGPARGSLVAPGTTLGGYPFYQGSQGWRFASSEVESTNNFGVSYGTVNLLDPEGGAFFAQMVVTANLNQSVDEFYLSSDDCAGSHLVRVVRLSPLGDGTTGDCMTINPYVATVGNKQITTLDVRITSSRNASRYYATRVVLDPAVLGLGGTQPVDWSRGELARHPVRSAFLDRLSAWGAEMQVAVQAAIGYDKPKDAFKKVTSLRDLRVRVEEAATTPENTVAKRLASLQALLDAGAISRDEYEQRRQALLTAL